MSLHATARVGDGVATITLAGELDDGSVSRLTELIGTARAAQVGQLVLNMARLTRMSSSGLRCLVDAHQKLGRDVRIVLSGAQRQVADTIRMSGFHQSVTMHDR